MEDRLIPKQIVLKILNIHRKTFEMLVKKGELPMVQISKNKRYVRESHLNEYLNKRTVNLPKVINEKPEVKNNFQWKSIFGSNK
jgi:excisionase family DNA binding protein